MKPECLQEQEYQARGPYHREFLTLPSYHPANLRYRIAIQLMPRSLQGFRCLDFGGGDGALSTLMANRGGAVMVADHSKLALNFARKGDQRLNVALSSSSLPFKNQAFDVVTMIETLEHIPDQYELGALHEAKRVMKQNGLFVISVPSTSKPFDKKHYRHYKMDELRNKVSQVGFKIKREVSYRHPIENFRQRPLVGKLSEVLFYGTDWALRNSGHLNGLTGCTPNRATDLMIVAISI